MTSNKSSHFSTTHRILHWLAALLMCVLFLTGFLRMTWMSKATVTSAVEQTITNVELTKAQKVAVAKKLRYPMWDFHKGAALLLLVVIGARLVYMARRGIRFPNPLDKKLTLKERLQGNIYLLFYLLVLIQIASGFFLQFGDGSLKGPIEDIHKLAIVWFPVFIILHLGGIVLAELSTKKGIVSNMIAGD